MVDSANSIWRDHPSDGQPDTGAHDPEKLAIREWATWVENAVTAGTLAGPWKASLALLNGDLAHDADAVGFVYTTADIGTYVKSGASGSGSWTKVLDYIPGNQVSLATDDTNSTANAHTMDTVPRASSGDGVTLLRGFWPATNTSATVTIAFDGGSALAVKTLANADPAVGGLVAGAPFIGHIAGSGTEFRLLSDQSGAAIQTAAEAAQTAAEAAEANALTHKNAAEAAAAAAAQKFFPVRVVDTASGDPATAYEAGDTIDGVTLVAADHVLRATSGGNAADGVYVVPASGAASRAATFDQYDDHPGAYFSVMEGTAKADTLWRVTSDAGGTLGVTAIAIEEYASSGSAEQRVTSLSALKAINTAETSVAHLDKAPRSRTFKFDSADLSSEMVIKSVASTSVDATSDTITVSGKHGLRDGDVVRLASAVNGLGANTRYWVKELSVEAIRYDGETAPFTVGATLTGDTSLATATIKRVEDFGTLGILWIESISGTFVNDETITDDNASPGSAAVTGVQFTTINTVELQLATSYGGSAVNLTGAGAMTMQHLLDPNEGVYVVADGAALDGSAGAWVAQNGWRLTGTDPRWFGMVASGTTAEAAANTAAFLAAKRFAVEADGPAEVVLAQEDAYYPINAGTNLLGEGGLTVSTRGKPELRIVGSGIGLHASEYTGVPGYPMYNSRLTGPLQITGNANITVGLRMKGMCQGSAVRDIEMRECTSRAFQVRHAVASQFDRLICSTNVSGAMTTTPNYVLEVDEDNAGAGYYSADALFTNTIAEGVAATGIQVTRAEGCEFRGGTPEALTKGATVEAGCRHIKFDSVWMEANTANDIVDSGENTMWINCRAASTSPSGSNVEALGEGIHFIGGYHRVINIQSTARHISATDAMLSDNASLGFIGNTQYLTIRNCKKVDTDIEITGVFDDQIAPGDYVVAGNTFSEFLRIENSSGAELFSMRLDGQINSMPPVHTLTSAASANVVVVNSAGGLARSTSALKYKTNRRDLEPDMVDAVMKMIGFTYADYRDPDGTRYVGLAADDFHDAGLSEFVTYNDDGEPEGLAYERIVAVLIEAVRQRDKRFAAIDDRLRALETA